MNWWFGELNNDYVEDCVFLYFDYLYKWNDVLCLVKYNFICEKE